MNFLSDPPAWVQTDEAMCFVWGFCMAASIRIFRATLRWLKKVAAARDERGED